MTYRTFLIDLDDTLYDERIYVDGGYKAVSEVAADAVNGDAADIFARLTYEHEKYGRHQIFNRLCKWLEIEETIIPDWVSLYRSTDRDLDFYDGTADALERLGKVAKVAIVTDGNAQMQRQKTRFLNLAPLVDTIVYCWEMEAPKPDPKTFIDAMKHLGGSPDETLIIGDDPYHDGMAADKAGIAFGRVRTGRFGQVDSPSLPKARHDEGALCDLITKVLD